MRDEFVRSVRRVVDKLLHTPTVQVKRLAEGPDGSSYAHALRELFELDPQTPAAVAVQRHGDVLAALEAPVQSVARHQEGRRDRGLRRSRRILSLRPVAARPGDAGDRPDPDRPLRLGTRPSALAVAQSELVGAAAARRRARRRAGHRQHLRRPLVAPIPTLGVGVFVSQLRDALVADEVDLAVHSYKDLPTAPDPRLVHRRNPAAGRPRDALVARDGRVLGELPAGATVGTGSPRRIAQLEALGLGCAGADPGQRRHPASRRSRRASSTRWSSRPPVCAGSAASTRRASCSTRCRCCPRPRRGRSPSNAASADTALAGLLAQVLDDAGTRAAVTAERAVLATLEAGCSAPVGALADVVSDLTDDGRVVDRVLLRAVVGTGDGALLRASATGDLDDAEKLGAALAAELLDMAGGSDRSGHDASTPRVTDPATTRPPRLRAGRPPRARSGARRRRGDPGPPAGPPYTLNQE